MKQPLEKQPLKKQPRLCGLSPALIRLLTEADRDLCCLEPKNPYRLYEFLHATAGRLAPVDAFYVCLYSEPHQALFFAYNVDGDVYDVPVTLPLGDGPTSRVVRQGRPVVWNNAEEALRVGGIMFGQMDRPSQAAMHVPIRAQDGKTVLGVLSAHTYGPHPYLPEAVAALQWLADRAGMALTRERDEAAWRYRLKAADALEADRQRPLVAQAEEFVAMLQRLGGQVEALRPLLPPGDTALAEAVCRLYRECCEAQTRANQLPLHPDLFAHTSQPPSLAGLTPSERAILRLIAEGKGNKAIAQALFVGEDTVKFHCKNIFQKLEVTSRTAAANVWLTSAQADS
jgi:DNA-binding CsgD family transcriptional regulator/GAF domain-containing protein